MTTETKLGIAAANAIKEAEKLQARYDRATRKHRTRMDALLNPVVGKALNQLTLAELRLFMDELPEDFTYRRIVADRIRALADRI